MLDELDLNTCYWYSFLDELKDAASICDIIDQSSINSSVDSEQKLMLYFHCSLLNFLIMT